MVDDGDAAEEIRRLRRTIKNIVTAVVVLAVVGVLWASYISNQRSAERHADEAVECVLQGRSDC